MKTVARRLYYPFHITVTTTEIIYNDQFLSYNNQALNFKNNTSCFGDGKLFSVDGNGKLQILYILKQIFLVENEYTSFLFIECTEIIWNE